jgi:hypothetical protein
MMDYNYESGADLLYAFDNQKQVILQVLFKLPFSKQGKSP